MNLKNKLKQQASKTLSTTSLDHVSHTSIEKVKEVETIDKITLKIRSHLQELEEIKHFFLVKKQEAAQLREQVIEMLIYVRDNKKTLLQTSFEQYLETEIGITKGYFYEQVQAYELCQYYHVPEYFTEIDYKILVMIARVKDLEEQKKLITKAPLLTREMFKKVSLTDKKNTSEKFKEIELMFETERKVVLSFTHDLTEQEKKEIFSLLEKKYKISL